MNCGICKKGMVEMKDKISCESCESSFHLHCANVQEAFLQALVENSIKWACGQCVKRKRLNRSVSEAQHVTLAPEQVADLRHFLDKFRNDLTIQINRVSEEQKQLEMDLGKSIETCHQKLDESLLLLHDQHKFLAKQQDAIEELKTENLLLIETIREIKMKLDKPGPEAILTDIDTTK